VAAGSAAEVDTALRLAVAWGYLDEADLATSFELLDRIRAMLWRLTSAPPCGADATFVT